MSNILRKTLTAVVGALFLSLFAIPTHAQSTDTSGSQGSILAVAGAESQEITADVQKEITKCNSFISQAGLDNSSAKIFPPNTPFFLAKL